VLSCGVQVIAGGGETNLHAHAGNDAVWLVLQGEAVFYGTGDQELARLGKYEGLLIPGGAPYWFESGSDAENLVILRVGAQDRNIQAGRVDYTERKFATSGSEGGGRRPVVFKEGTFFGD
jgi:mannose-6-phosphate isomerase-like protein (cupin superfamily)